jgi:hypothetical protein
MRRRPPIVGQDPGIRWFKIVAVSTMVAMVGTLVSIAVWSLVDGDWKGAVGWLICAALVGLPSRHDPAIQWKQRHDP